MADFALCERDQAFLLPPDMKNWLPDDDLAQFVPAQFVIAASERVSMSAVQVNGRNSGKPRYHPRMMLALLVYASANGLFSSRRIERATRRDIGARFVTPDTRHEYRQAYNARAVVRADGAQLVQAANLVATSANAPSFAATILGMRGTVGLPKRVPADTGYASGPAPAVLDGRLQNLRRAA